MLICALCVVPIIFAARASNLWVAVALVSLGMSAHQGWSANLYTITSDMFPRNAVGSAIGIGGNGWGPRWDVRGYGRRLHLADNRELLFPLRDRRFHVFNRFRYYSFACPSSGTGRRLSVCYGSMQRILLMLLLAPLWPANAQTPGMTNQEKAIQDRMGLQKLPDSDRTRVTKALALEIRELPASVNKLTLHPALQISPLRATSVATRFRKSRRH